LGGAVRGRRRVRRPGLSSDGAVRSPHPESEGTTGREYDPRPGRNRCGAEQGTGRGVRDRRARWVRPAQPHRAPALRLAHRIPRAHTTLDGDTVFAAATGRRPLGDAINELTELGAVGANTLARAVARGVFEAKALPSGPPSWRDCHGR